MLSKSYRLSAKEIPLVIKSGKRQSLKYFSIASLPSTNPLFSIVISTKTAKHSSKRNKIKRQLKEAIGKNLDKFQNKKTVLFAKKEIINAKFSEILDEINNIKTN